MENLFDDNELKQFLEDETKQHRMYPSDKIWRNIQSELHGKKRWPALPFITLLIISALTVSTLINSHPIPITAAKPVVQQEKNVAVADKTETVAYKEQLFANNLTAKTFASIKEKTRKEELKAYEALVKSANITAASVVNEDRNEVVLYEPHIVDAADNISKNITASLNDTYKKVEKEIKNRLNKTESRPLAVVAANATPTTEKTTVAQNNKIITNALLKENKNSIFKQPVDDNPSLNEELVTGTRSNIAKLKKKPSRFEVQFYITPSVSYRKLVDDKERNNYERPSVTTIPADLNSTVNLDDVVRHKPAMGIEFGVGVMYKLTNNLRIKTGLQLNSRQYYIAGYQSLYGGGKLAAITLVEGNRLDTLYQYSNFSSNTSNGARKSQLDNKLYQISIPIGLQWDFLQGKHLGLSIGASIQPTLTLNKNIYLISTDYKYYTDGTPFFRRWNINSSTELNLTYKVGSYKWYIGPQLRYQHLPTYTENYPIKEYRLDYGLKIGFTKPL